MLPLLGWVEVVRRPRADARRLVVVSGGVGLGEADTERPWSAVAFSMVWFIYWAILWMEGGWFNNGGDTFVTIDCPTLVGSKSVRYH